MCITIYMTMVEVSPSGFLTPAVDTLENHLGLACISQNVLVHGLCFQLLSTYCVFPFVISGTHVEHVALVVKEHSSHSSPSLF